MSDCSQGTQPCLLFGGTVTKVFQDPRPGTDEKDWASGGSNAALVVPGWG